jgi:hypothetical protein
MGIEPGDCDLRVYVDGELISILGFQISPSVKDRWAGRRQQREDRAQTRLVDNEPDYNDDDVPISLEDLLRQSNTRD